MNVCYVSTFYPESVTTADEMLARWPLLRRLPPALVSHGHQVTVLAHAGASDVRDLDGANYEFVNPGPVARSVAGIIHRWKPRYGPAYYLPAFHIVRHLRQLRPDVVHFAGLTLDLHLALVARECRRQSIPLVVHFHGGVPDRGRLRRIQHWNAANVDRVLVTTLEQGEPWVSVGDLRADQLVEVVESSSPFAGMPRREAQTLTGMVGDPVYLSAGRLDAIKDPLTMLRAFERISAVQRDARLYLYYLTDELLNDIVAFLDARPDLAERVALRGRAPLDEMEAIYSSADVLLQASTREWSGLAVIEAMSCGCIPIVTDIPSFRKITDHGRVGRLVPVGDANAMAKAALALTASERGPLSAAAREHFAESLSFDAMARAISGVYVEVVEARRGLDRVGRVQ